MASCQQKDRASSFSPDSFVVLLEQLRSCSSLLAEQLVEFNLHIDGRICSTIKALLTQVPSDAELGIPMSTSTLDLICT